MPVPSALFVHARVLISLTYVSSIFYKHILYRTKHNTLLETRASIDVLNRRGAIFITNQRNRPAETVLPIIRIFL